MRNYLNRRVPTFSILFAVIILLSSCSSYSPFAAQKNAIPTLPPTPKPTTPPPCTDNCPPISTIPGGHPFPDTWNNIHLFQTFTFDLDNSAIRNIADAYDFVWGARPENVPAFRADNPAILLSYYIPLNRDNGTFDNNSLGREHTLAYWKALHPDWLLYKCNRVTPALQFSDPNLSFDFTNPAVINWQFQTYALPASEHGYDALAVDNLNLENMFGACGFYRNGKWVQRYTGQQNDLQWRLDLLNWITEMQKALHELPHPLALIPNIGYGSIPLSLDDTYLQALVNHIDGILDESGFTLYGKSYVTGGNWLKMVQFIQAVQQRDKPYYILDEFPRPSINRNQLQWALSSYLICKGHLAAIYLAPWQKYGSDNRRPEYSANIGIPTGDMYWNQGVYWRNYSNGLVVVNPNNTPSATITLDSPAYVDLYGQPINQNFTLHGHSGIVLLKHGSL